MVEETFHCIRDIPKVCTVTNSNLSGQYDSSFSSLLPFSIGEVSACLPIPLGKWGCLHHRIERQPRGSDTFSV
jgi:hypothetical protein